MHRNKRVLIIVQNLPVPFDRRVWQEALTLHGNGYEIAIICPKGNGFIKPYEYLEGIHIYRHSLPLEAKGAAGYALEYSWSLLCEFYLACKVFLIHDFDVIHACNPPDNIFLIAGFFRLMFGRKFIFDHHDINPELYEAKFGRQDFFYKVICLLERLTFRTADISIATNDSYRRIAVERGGMPPDKVFVVRSGPDLTRMRITAPVASLKNGRKYLVGYVGVMGKQEGLEYLLEAIRYIIHDVKRTDIHFTIVGSGTELVRLQKSASTLDIENYINFTGRLPDNELLAVLNSSDICVNPDEVNALNDKSTMNKIMEYMAVGKAIVQFDVKEGRVSAGKSSMYAKANDAVDFANKIIWLLDNPEEREAMGRLGRQRIENALAWEYEAPKLLAAYDKVFCGLDDTKSPLQKLLWYGNRLAAMSAREICFRINEKLKREKDRHLPPILPAQTYDRLPVIPNLYEKISECHIPEKLIAEWEELYTQSCRGDFFLLARKWPDCQIAKKWHIDPVTGKYWPDDKYCHDINFRHNHEYGDVKYVWELNRLQYLQPLAALALKRNDAIIFNFCISEIESWIDNNPPYSGINWASGIELAMRLTTIFFVTSLAGEHVTQVQREKIWQTIQTHAIWLARYPSRFSSANNHLAAEGLGLFMAGALCPELENSLSWKTEGWKLLCDTAVNQILPDGTGAEQAISYTAFTLEMLMLGLVIARACNMEIPEYYMQRVETSGEYLRWFTDCKGNHPLIGDDDNARVIGHYSHSEKYVSSILGCIAAITERGDLTPSGSQPHLRNIIFGFAPYAIEAQKGVRSFNDGGYTVGRHKAQGKEIVLAIDHGPLGYLSIAAHGHADTLAVWLHINGQPVLVDSGTYLYHSGGKWRNYFRATAAHNTLCVEKSGSSVMSGAFNWSRKAKPNLLFTEYGENYWRLSAEHDGYKNKFGVLHRRNLEVTPDKGFTIEDTLIGKRSRYVDIGFAIHPSLQVIATGNNIEISMDGEIFLKLTHESCLAQSIEENWYCPRFGEKLPARRIVFSGVLTPGQKAVTRFSYE